MTDNFSPFEIPEVTDREILFNDFGQLRRDRLRLPNQENYDYYTFVTAQTAVTIIAQCPDGRFIINHEYRHPTEKILLSLPGGLLDKGETVEAAASRELLEETGYAGENIKVLGEAYPLPGVSTTKIVYVSIENCKKVQNPQLEPAELLVTTLFDEKALMDKVREGVPVDSTLCAGLWYWQLNNNNS